MKPMFRKREKQLNKKVMQYIYDQHQQQIPGFEVEPVKWGRFNIGWNYYGEVVENNQRYYISTAHHLFTRSQPVEVFVDDGNGLKKDEKWLSSFLTRHSI
jgi:hypothetical protein